VSVLGRSVRRVEDRALLTGQATFTADLARHQADALDVVFVRATVAHARIVAIDSAAACCAPGVVLVVTAADFDDVRGSSPIPVPEDLVRPFIARDVVRFCGEIVAAVVARGLAAAADAAELVEVRYEALPIANFDSNAVLCTDADHEAVARASEVFAQAALVVEMDIVNQRVAAAPLEGLSVLVVPDGDDLVLTGSTQTPHSVRDGIAARCDLRPDAVRVVAPWVGGGFGAKSMAEAEYLLVAKLALRLRGPLRWTQTRTENLLTMHGRDQDQHVRLALGADGTMEALHVDLVSNNGAYPGLNHLLAGLTAKMLAGPYRVGHVTSTIRSVATNTSPVLGYRGAGRPEATSLIERVLDVAAHALQLDPAEIRRRNLLHPTQFPYFTPTGARYDVGEYAAALDCALELARYADRRREQAEGRKTNATKQLGIGLCTYVEVTAGAGPTEFADVQVHDDETVTVRVGTFGHGQGHRTTYAQIAAASLGVAMEAVTVVDGDTAAVARGYGTYGSRSMQVGGSAVHEACGVVIERGRELAAVLLEAAVDDVVVHAGRFSVAGVPARSFGWREIVALALDAPCSGGAEPVAPVARGGLYAQIDWERPDSTYPFGAHVAIVEVDTETGEVRLVDHIAVDDCGNRLNPLLVQGQIHGGIAQGVAQALWEAVVHDDNGNVQNASFAEYAIPTAAELVNYTLGDSITPTPVNPLGVKGIGESGTIGATPAVLNAVIDALTPFGVVHLDMPCSAEKVWRACNGNHPEVRLLRNCMED
jgi:aerobic carbon-monoxide dehydrogenase large subunit